MRRIPHFKIPLPVFTPTRVSWVHKKRRNDYLFDPKVKFPIYSRLPQFWRKEFEKPLPLIHQVEQIGTRRPQHGGLWKRGRCGVPERVENIPISIYYPPMSREGIWAGEGLIRGNRYARGGDPRSRLYCKEWKPLLLKRDFYSEILDDVISTTFTSRALDLIDAAFGFDFFILQTQTNVLQEFGGGVKRRMLLTLARKDIALYPKDPEKREKIYKKYQKYVIPEEEAEWVGLNLYQAMHKQWKVEKESGKHDPIPLLEVYTKELLEKLSVESDEAPTGEAPNVAAFQMKETTS